MQTPLNGILGYSEVIMTEMLGPIGKNTYKEYASDIHGAGQELIDNLLELKELETTEFELREEQFYLISLLQKCVLSCVDNGKGMTPQEITKAFSNDTQLDDIYSDPCKGIGFGISFVKKIMEKHGGNLSILSAPGAVTTLNLNLPKDRLIYSKK